MKLRNMACEWLEDEGMFQVKEDGDGVGRRDQTLQSLVKQWKLPRSAKQKIVTIISPSIPLMKGQD